VSPERLHAGLRDDLKAIADMITPGTRVLDVGCGDGALLEYLMRACDVDARGIELSQAGVNACVTRGLAVIQGDADTDLEGYPDKAFDTAILSQTIQATRRPKVVLQELLRIAEHAIVSFPNFGHWRVRLALGLRGRMPMTDALDTPWYDTANIHLCTIADFTALVGAVGAEVEQAMALSGGQAPKPFRPFSARANLLSETAIFRLRKI